MESLLRSATQVPIRSRADVLVVGAGPADIGAAITAARAGAKVTLVEEGGKLGGMWTLGLVSPFFDAGQICIVHGGFGIPFGAQSM